MKRTIALAVAVFSFALVGHSQSLIEAFSGVWLCTKAPVPSQRISGRLEVLLYDNGIAEVRSYLGSQLIETIYGVHTSIDPVRRRVTFTDGDGWKYVGVAKLGFISGTFQQPLTRLYAGKWQGTSATVN